MVARIRIFKHILFGLIFCTGSVLAQGLYYESALEGGMMGSGPMVTKTYIAPKMMKQVSGEDQDFMVMRMDQEKMYSIDLKEKAYWEMTFAEFEATMKKASAKMDKQMAELEEQLKNMPEEQRKMMEQMMGGKMGKKPGDVTVLKTAETKKIAGYACTKHVVKEGERELMTIWATKDIKVFESIRNDFRAFSNRMLGMNPKFVKGMTEAMLNIEGFPMETDFGPMKSTVTKVEARSIPASEFAVPAGFKKIPPPMKEMAGEEDGN